jgi:hypothetical protein
MRSSLSILLALMLSLNAAYMASVGVCNALEHSTSHAEHFGHQSHDHSDDHDHDDHDDQLAGVDEPDKTALVSDHHHDHVHPAFTIILPDSIGIVPLVDDGAMVSNLAETFVSAPPTLLERPPRATLA